MKWKLDEALYKGEKSSLFLCVSFFFFFQTFLVFCCVQRLQHLQHQVCGFFLPHQAVLSDISCVLFLPYLAGNWLRENHQMPNVTICNRCNTTKNKRGHARNQRTKRPDEAKRGGHARGHGEDSSRCNAANRNCGKGFTISSCRLRPNQATYQIGEAIGK